MLTIKEINDKQKYGVSKDRIVLEGKDGEEVYGYVVCSVQGNVFVIEKMACEDALLADGLKRSAFNYALNRNIVEADYLGESVDIIEFFSKGCH